MFNELKKKSVDDLKNMAKNVFVYEDNEEAMVEFLKEKGADSDENIDDADYSLIEYLTNDAFDWMDKDQLIEFIIDYDLVVLE